jgi:hypothetical protein
MTIADHKKIRFLSWLAAAVGAITMGGCGGGDDGGTTSPGPVQDGGSDTASPDAPLPDGGEDADASTTPDAVDAAEEPSPEADAGPDAPGDAAPEVEAGDDATFEAGDDATFEAGVCTSGATECDGADVLKTCDSTGNWQTVQCPFLCSNGACTGSCVPGTSQCDNATLQTCTSAGQWQDVQVCQYACLNLACTTCQPGAVKCSGLVRQQCSTTTGAWTDVETCPYVCFGGACVGECVPGTKGCNGNVAQTCDSSGVWQDDTTCPFACVGGACTGVCIPGTIRCSSGYPWASETCNVQGQWDSTPCPAPPNAYGTCSGAGVCGYECTPSWYGDCDGQAVNGCESDSFSDGANCGSCGRDCLGGACVQGVCQPAVVTSGHESLADLKVDATNVYFVERPVGNYSVNSVPKGGGAVTHIYTSATYFPITLTIDATTAFWRESWFDGTTNHYRINSVPLVGGVSTPVLDSAVSTGLPLECDATHLFFSLVAPTNELRRIPKSGGPSDVVATGAVADLVVLDGYVYWVTSQEVRRVPVGGGTATTLATLASTASGKAVAVDDQNVYWVETSTVGSPKLMATWKGGDVPVTMATLGGFGRPIILVDATDLYVHGNSVIYRVPKQGGQAVSFASIGVNSWIAQDADAVYWTDQTTKTIYRLPK